MDRFARPAAAGPQHALQAPQAPSFDLQLLLCDVAELYLAAAHGTPVELRFDLDAGLPRFLLGHGKRLQQLLAHLGSHAIRSCTQAEITLVVEVERMTATEASLIFSLRDGDTPDGRRANTVQTLTQRFAGTRQGLAHCMRLVKALGGELELMHPPQGPGHCQLSLSLPIAPRATVSAGYCQ